MPLHTRVYFLPFLLLLGLPPAQSQTLTEMRRVYDDNSTWRISTATGSISLKNLYADGSEWLVSGGGKTYHLKRTYNDDSEWQVSETGTALRRAYQQDNTEWRVQRGQQTTSIRDRYKDGAQWDGDGFGLTRTFADNSAWVIADQARAQSLDVKLLLVFAALYSDLSRP